MNQTNQSWFDRNSINIGIVFWGILIGLAIFWAFLAVALPKYKYSKASSYEKCQIDLKKLNDSDKFCDTNDKIKSYKEIAEAKTAADEAARKAKLTPKQRCEEEHKGFSDEDGEYYTVLCKDDGSYDIQSASELYEDAMDDYYNDMQEDIYDAPLGANNNCNPNYSPCIPNGADLDCPDIGFTVKVIGSDVYRLDRDKDGYGCE